MSTIYGDAVVVLGALFGARYPNLVPAASRRRLVVLGIDAPTAGKRRFDEARRAHPEHPLAPIADLTWIPGDRHEEVLEQVIRWQANYRIRGVLAFGEDYVGAAGVVADYLGLPSPGLRASRVCRDKFLQRRYLARWSPRSRLLAPGDRRRAAEEWSSFPAVLKPTGREASSGVLRVDGRAELVAALDDYEPSEPLLVEQLVAGHEVSVEALTQDGRIVFASVTGKRTTEACGQYFVEMGHTAPDPELDDVTRDAVLETNQAVLERLAFRDGISHAEYRITEEGRVYLMEIAARAAGDSILTLYHLATGEPMEEAMLAIALGEPAAYPPPRRYARQVYVQHRPGVLHAVHVDGLDAEVTWLPERWMWPAVQPTEDASALHMVVVGRNQGDELSDIRQSADRSLMYVIDAASPGHLDALEARCDQAISLDVGSG
jgi:biotin carboxylase